MTQTSSGRFRLLRCIAGLLPVLGLAGCVLVRVPAKPVTSTSGDVEPSDVMALSVIFSSDFSPGTPETLGREMIECVRRGLGKEAPQVRLVSHEEFHRVVFPGLKPAEVLLRADTLPVLLARPEIRQRINQLGLTHLLLVGGLTERAGTRPVGVVGYGGGFVVGGQREQTRLSATLFELSRGAEVTRVTAAAAGEVVAVAIFPFPLIPLGGGTDPETPSCEALGAEVGQVVSAKRGDGRR